ncbi:MAG: hypothetical protein U0586_07930 [Candidatus Brocadiaceae bacterium]
MRKKRSLYDAYHFPGFKPQRRVSGIFGDPNALVIKFSRQGKKQFAVLVTEFTVPSTTARIDKFAIYPAAIGVCTSSLRFDAFSV